MITKLFRLAFRTLLVSLFWRLSWSRINPFKVLRVLSTAAWCKNQNAIGDFAGWFVNQSGWKGMYCKADGKDCVLTIQETPKTAEGVNG